MKPLFDMLLGFLAEAWQVLVSVLLFLGLTAVLLQTLRAAGSTVIGARIEFARAASAFFGIVMLLLFTALGVPALVDAASLVSESCGPLVELGAGIARLIAALSGIRMLVAAARAIVMNAVGGGSMFGDVLIEAGEAVLAMLFSVLAAPIAANFLGKC